MGKFGHSSAGAARPVKDAQVRDARRSVEQEGGFDWTPVVLLGVMGATALFSFDRAYQKYEKDKEEGEEDEKNRKEDDDEERRRRRRRREEEEERRRGGRRGKSEERRRRRSSRGRSLDEWDEEEREVDENGFYVSRRGRARSRVGYDRYDRGHDRGYDRGYSADYYDRYDRYGGSRRGTSTW